MSSVACLCHAVLSKQRIIVVAACVQTSWQLESEGDCVSVLDETLAAPGFTNMLLTPPASPQLQLQLVLLLLLLLALLLLLLLLLRLTSVSSVFMLRVCLLGPANWNWGTAWYATMPSSRVAFLAYR
jgi:hypothetical protein